jgi:hypothetical protein
VLHIRFRPAANGLPSRLDLEQHSCTDCPAKCNAVASLPAATPLKGRSHCGVANSAAAPPLRAPLALSRPQLRSSLVARN